MEYDPARGRAVLARTPGCMNSMLRGLPDAWTHATEGEGTWSPYDIVGHLISGEQSDWIPRVRRILEHGESRPFEPFNRTGMFEASRGKSLEELLDQFQELRQHNLKTYDAFDLTPDHLSRTGTHPEFGVVTLAQLLATWVAHDLGHIAQTARVMAKQYGAAVGPWREYLRIVRE